MRRLERLFGPDGKVVIVAVDHGLGLDVVPALNDTAAVLRKIDEGGADAILTSFGIAQKYEKELQNLKLVLRLDGGTTLLTGNPSGTALYSVDEALEMGADGVACMGFPGASNERETLQNLAEIAADARRWGLPLVAEMLPGGFEGTVEQNVENIRLAARVGSEHGAHIIKTVYNGSVEEFKTVVEGSFSPVIVLGGAHTKDLSGLMKVIEQAIAAGAAGVAIGRNVWKHPKPDKVTRAIVDIVHGGKKASEVISDL
ncbi:MAG: class I fructose-bisphosphate aldolase [Spirochaetaceae bacterium]